MKYRIEYYSHLAAKWIDYSDGYATRQDAQDAIDRADANDRFVDTDVRVVEYSN